MKRSLRLFGLATLLAWGIITPIAHTHLTTRADTARTGSGWIHRMSK